MFNKKIIWAFLFLLTLFLTAPNAGAQYVTFNGSGWGHGVGLSQYGAKALGVDGANHQQILFHYFPETQIKPLSLLGENVFINDQEKPLWVGIRQNAQNIAIVLEENSEICFDDNNLCFTGESNDEWRFLMNASGGCVFYRKQASDLVISREGSCNASVRPVSGVQGVTIPVKARTYKQGIVRFRENNLNTGFHVVMQIGLEDYMRGVSAVPESWPEATIRAQVIASRSLAARSAMEVGSEKNFSEETKQSCHCNLYDDDSNQIFRGFTGEKTHPKWVEAVQETSGLVLTYENLPALGLFSSSSGGFSENYEDIFSSGEHPYLISVSDSQSFSDSAGNPHKSWSARYDQSRIAREFGFSWITGMRVSERNESGSSKLVEIRGIFAGRPLVLSVSALELQNALSLRSITYEVSVQQRFFDVANDHSFGGEILGLEILGITNGCTPNKFCPDSFVTRGEMAAFITRANELNVLNTQNTFNDDENHIFEEEIEALAAAGITSGCTPNKFCPDSFVTRGEMAAFIIRANES